VAATYLALLGALFAGVTLVHALVVYAWTTIPYTAAIALPAFLLFPAVEVLLLNLLALPVGMYAMLLLVQAPNPAQRFLGAVVFLLVLAYLSWVTALLLYVVRHKRALGLCDTEAASDSPPSSEAPSTFYDRSMNSMLPFIWSGHSKQSTKGDNGPSHSSNNSRTLLLPDTQSASSSQASSSMYTMPMVVLSVPGITPTPAYLMKDYPGGLQSPKGDMSIVIADKDIDGSSTASKSFSKSFGKSFGKSFSKGTASSKSRSWSMGARSKKELQSLHGGGQCTAARVHLC
jgi:hypothetical protein